MFRAKDAAVKLITSAAVTQLDPLTRITLTVRNQCSIV